MKPVEFVVLQDRTDAPLVFLEQETLVRGDIFVVDNCTIHVKGDYIGLQRTLF